MERVTLILAVYTLEKQPESTQMTEASTTAEKPQITFDDFVKLDLRVAKVVQAENHPNADRLLKLQVDDGSGTPRQICAGIRDQYSAEDILGKLIVIVANLAPRTIRGEESRGMLMAASNAEKGAEERKVIVITPMSDIEPGSIVS